MNDRPTTLERAYELASSGECRGLGEIRERLKREGYRDVQGQLYGPTLAKALNRLCAEARQSKPDEPATSEGSFG